MPKTTRGRLVRWGVPVAAVAVVAAAAGAGPVIAAVQGDPVLPERSAEQLLAAAIDAGRDGVPPMSGTIVENASLGLPELPGFGTGAGGSSSPMSLLAGSNQVKVWYGGDDKIRLALPGQMSETDLIHNGDQTWVWDSEANTATRIKTPKDLPEHAHDRGDKPGRPGHGAGGPGGVAATLTPQGAAQEVLKRVGEDTTVSVADDEQVAGRDAYQLELAPKDERSLVDKVTIALDGQNYVPLRVQVFADGTAEPAFEVGFSSVTFTQPAPEMFTFTPPAGATVKEQGLGEYAKEHDARPHADRPEAGKDIGQAKRIGDGWTTIVSVPFSQDDLAKLISGDERGRDGDDRNGRADAGGLVKSVLDQATPVSGAWGSGKLIRTKLLTVLVTDDGRVLAGAVTPDALYEAAGKK